MKLYDDIISTAEDKEITITKKIGVNYLGGESIHTPGLGVDYMIADIADLGLGVDRLYAEIDPAICIEELGGADWLVSVLHEDEAAIRTFCEEHGVPEGEDELNEILEFLAEECDRDFLTISEDMQSALSNASEATEPYLKAEIIRQAEAIGINAKWLDFD